MTTYCFATEHVSHRPGFESCVGLESPPGACRSMHLPPLYIRASRATRVMPDAKPSVPPQELVGPVSGDSYAIFRCGDRLPLCYRPRALRGYNRGSDCRRLRGAFSTCRGQDTSSCRSCARSRGILSPMVLIFVIFTCPACGSAAPGSSAATGQLAFQAER